MRLMFDAAELTPDSGKSLGIYRYARGLVSEMAKQMDSGDEVLLVCNGANQSDFAEALAHEGVRQFQLCPNMPGHLWRQAWMRGGAAVWARQHGVDVYLSPKGFVPRNLCWPADVPRMTVVHDLIPFWYFQGLPRHFGRLETWLVTSAFRNTFAHADHVIAISFHTQRELLGAGMQSSRVSVVLNGVDAPAPPGGSPEVLPADLGGRAFVFAMASTLPHKNLNGVLEAYARYRELAGQHALPLALCGVSDISQPGVVPLGRVTDAELESLYREAQLFLFLSLTEGFGYPPIEALRVGTPVICSDIGVLEEVAGELAVYVPPDQPDLVAQAMYKGLATPLRPDQRLDLMRAAQQRIATKLSWPDCAAGVWAAIRKVLTERQSSEEACA